MRPARRQENAEQVLARGDVSDLEGRAARLGPVELDAGSVGRQLVLVRRCKLLWKVDQFREVLLSKHRVWVLVDDLRRPGMNPGVVEFLDENCTIEHEFFGGQVLLWDRAGGKFSTAADQGGAADSF